MERINLQVYKEKWQRFISVINFVPTDSLLKLYRLQKSGKLEEVDKLVETETNKVLKTQGADKGD